MTYQPTVVLVDDHDLVRAGVRAELGDKVRVVAEAADVFDAVDVIAETRPDVVLLDVHLPSGTGTDVIAAVLERGVATNFLALSVSDDPDDVISVIRAGARGYVTKAIKGDDLVASIFRVSEGDAVFSPRLAGFVIDAFSSSLAPAAAAADDDVDQLSPREKEVMRLLARGYAYKEIARRLTISVKTVETHASAVLRKLQLSSRHELQSWAARRKIV
ncbi:MAG: response regulator [Acidimicrobiales bacterium]